MNALKLLVLSLSIVGFIFSGGCTEDEESNPTQASSTESDCIGCHSNQEMLVATMTEDTTPDPENPGEG